MSFEKRIILFFLLLFIINSSIHAQESKSSPSPKRKYFLTTEFQTLRTTHATFFNGGDLAFGYHLFPKILMSIGAEYSYDYYHNDNDWNLYNLKMLPVFIDAKFILVRNKKISAFLQTSEGISFINFYKESIYNAFPPHHVSEVGFYAYAGGGANIRISDHVLFQLGVGIKSFHLSTYVWTVNPHGLTVRPGFVFIL